MNIYSHIYISIVYITVIYIYIYFIMINDILFQCSSSKDNLNIFGTPNFWSCNLSWCTHHPNTVLWTVIWPCPTFDLPVLWFRTTVASWKPTSSPKVEHGKTVKPMNLPLISVSFTFEKPCMLHHVGSYHWGNRNNWSLSGLRPVQHHTPQSACEAPRHRPLEIDLG